jgi:hypothetical protein
VTLLIREEERSQREWNRKARDAVNMLIRRVTGIGTSAERPAYPTDGQMFYDRSLKRPVWWNSADAEWKDAAGTPA